MDAVRCDKCEKRAVVSWRGFGFCADCASALDAVRLHNGLRAMCWSEVDEVAE